MKKTTLTGIKPTGTPHVGNYFGAIKPAIEMAESGRSFYFIADYHALNQIRDAKLLGQYIREISCTWLACGLDVNKVVFYRQSDVPEVFELATILTNVTPKGLMNRAHAYKAMVQEGREDEVNMGLFNYPILQAADIMIMGATHVPVGADQKQHLEIASDIAKSFSAVYGEVLVVPSPSIQATQATIPGLDGRKMSKSYGNQIPLFCTSAELKKHIMRITTDSSAPNEPKPTDHAIFQMHKLFATAEESANLKKRFETGIGWGDAKNELFSVAERTLSPMRDRYNELMANFGQVEMQLLVGAKQAREVAKQTIAKVRGAICNQ